MDQMYNKKSIFESFYGILVEFSDFWAWDILLSNDVKIHIICHERYRRDTAVRPPDLRLEHDSLVTPL